MNSVVETRDPFGAAKLAGLRYVSDVRRGIARRRAGMSFSYTADVDGAKLTFHFRGKSGKEHSIGVRDRRLARIVGRCQAIEGEERFQYVDDAGAKHAIESGDVNDYLRTIAEDDFTAKDFRTWAGTVLAAEALNELGFQSATEAKRNIAHAIKSVASRLGNTPSVCRKCYVHPAVLDAYEEGALARALAAASRKPSANALAPSEAAVRALLAQRLAAAAA